MGSACAVQYIACFGMNQNLLPWLEEDAALLAFLWGEENNLFEAINSGAVKGRGTASRTWFPVEISGWTGCGSSQDQVLGP